MYMLITTDVNYAHCADICGHMYKYVNYSVCYFSGACDKWLMQETDRFAKFKMQCAAEKEPRADGVLVFNEVKVISRMMWNSISQTMIGFAMSYEEMSGCVPKYCW